MNARTSGSEDVLYAFGPFTLDPVVGVLRKHGIIVPLPNKSVELLALLVQRRGQLVAKEDLLTTIWPDVEVEENNLARHISNLRKVLDDHRTGPEFIVTVLGRGYRFVALVHETARKDLEELPPVEAPSSVLDASPPEDAVNTRAVDQPTTSALRMKRPPLRVAIALAIVLVLSLVAVLFAWRVRPAAPAQPKLWQLTFDPGVQMQPVWSPDGRRIAYAADRSGNSDIWVQAIDEGDAEQVTFSTAHDWQPAWSPDGRYLVFRSERAGGGLFVVSPAGGTEKRISDFGYHPQWSPNGASILFYDEIPRGIDGFGRANSIYAISVDGGPARRLLSGLSKSFISFRARWHPDGDRISVWGNHESSGWSFWTSSSDDWKPVRSDIAPAIKGQLRAADVTLADFSWSPRGDALFFEGREGSVSNIWRVRVEPGTLRWQEANRLTTGAERNVGVAVSPDGSKLAFSVRSEQTRLWALPFDAMNGRTIGQGAPVLAEGADVQYDVSSDGRVLVYRTLRRGTQQLWRRSIAGGDSQLLVSAQSLSVPRLSRDGKRVIFRRARHLQDEDSAVEQEIVLLATEGGQPQRLTTPERSSRADLSTLVPFDWSADGSRILSPCRVANYMGICLMSLSQAPHAERGMQVLASSPDRNLVQAQFSPDERLICFNAVQMTPGRPRKSTIHVAPIAGGQWVAITSGDFWDDKARWSSDGRTIYYVSLRDGFFNVWGRAFDPTQKQPVGEPFRVTAFESLEHSIFPDVSRLHIAISNDRLILPMTDVSSTVWVLENTDR